MYDVHTPPAPIPSVQIPVRTSFPATTTTSLQSVFVEVSTKSVEFPKTTPRQASVKASVLKDTITPILQPPKSSTAVLTDPVSSNPAALPKVSAKFTNPALSTVESNAVLPQQPVSPAPANIAYVGISYSRRPDSAVIIGAQTLEPGGPPITVSDNVISLSPEGTQLAVGDSSESRTVLLLVNVLSGLISTPIPTPTTLVIGSQTITVQPGASEIQIGGQTITAGGFGITINGGTYISLASSNSALIVGGSTVTLENVPSSISGGSSETIITLAGQPVTLGPDTPIVFDGTTLSAGSAVTISGTPVSFSPSNSVLHVGGSVITLFPTTTTTLRTPNAPARLFTIAGTPVTFTPGAPIVLDGTTLTPSGPALTVSGTLISLGASSKYLVIGTSSIPFSAEIEIVTIGTRIVTANSASEFILNGQTLIPGGSGIIVDGTTVSLALGTTEVVVAGRTESTGHRLGGLIWSGIGGSISVPVQTGTGGTSIGGFTGDTSKGKQVSWWGLVCGGIALIVFCH